MNYLPWFDNALHSDKNHASRLSLGPAFLSLSLCPLAPSLSAQSELLRSRRSVPAFPVRAIELWLCRGRCGEDASTRGRQYRQPPAGPPSELHQPELQSARRLPRRMLDLDRASRFLYALDQVPPSGDGPAHHYIHTRKQWSGGFGAAVGGSRYRVANRLRNAYRKIPLCPGHSCAACSTNSAVSPSPYLDRNQAAPIKRSCRC